MAEPSKTINFLVLNSRKKLKPLSCLSGLIGSFLMDKHKRSPYSFLVKPSQSDLAESVQSIPRRLAPLHCFPPLFGAGFVQVRSWEFSGMLPVIWHWFTGQFFSGDVHGDQPPSTTTGRGVFCLKIKKLSVVKAAKTRYKVFKIYDSRPCLASTSLTPLKIAC